MTLEEFWAIKDLTFEIKKGEAIAIIGRNGAGKSTLLKLLSRITSPSHGRIELDGRVASLLEVGTGFHPELTGRENIYLNGTILGMTRREINRKFDEIVAFAEVEKFLDTQVKRYSSGMYVRLGFAVAAFLESEILVVDEVLAVGDAEFQKKCLKKMNEAKHSDRTVIFVSHNMAAVQQLCQTGILLQNGRLVTKDKIEVVVNEYLKYTGTMESKLELGSKSRPWGRDERVALLELDINQGEKLLFDKPCNFTVLISCDTMIKDLHIEIGFSGSDGIRYATYDSSRNRNPLELKEGRNAIQLTVGNLPLQPSIYSIDLGIHSGGSGLDYLPGVTQVEIFPSPNTPLYRTGGERGLTLHGDWKSEKYI